ncbi:MAG: hypothetical protein N2748_00820 [candidate division WOR-3 bacterium]|nr:hypothetical protein [candidate division WOR-3 bacterium]
MRISKIFLYVILFLGLANYLNAQVAYVNSIHFRQNGPTLNDVCYISTTNPNVVAYIAVGERGWIYRLKNFGFEIQDSMQIGNGKHDLMGVSFSGRTGWAVGYINSGDSMWKGVIWKSEDRGQTWVRQTNIFNLPPINIPFLKVHTVSSNIAWISCGHGYVLRTINGIDWNATVRRPGGTSH